MPLAYLFNIGSDVGLHWARSAGLGLKMWFIKKKDLSTIGTMLDITPVSTRAVFRDSGFRTSSCIERRWSRHNYATEKQLCNPTLNTFPM